MSKIEIEEKNLEAAYAVASEETKKVLDALFGRTMEPKKKPTLDDYTTIKTYGDACEALDITPIYSKDAKRAVCEYIGKHWDYRQTMPNHILALMKLETISRALWGRTWKPKTEFSEDNHCYTPLFGLKNGTLAPPPVTSYNVGYINIPRALCQETAGKAEYFGRQFLDLWAEYLGFDVKKEGGER